MLIASHQHEAVELDKLSVRETVSVLVRIVDVECRDLYEGESDPRLSWSLLQISHDDVSRMELILKISRVDQESFRRAMGVDNNIVRHCYSTEVQANSTNVPTCGGMELVGQRLESCINCQGGCIWKEKGMSYLFSSK